MASRIARFGKLDKNIRRQIFVAKICEEGRETRCLFHWHRQLPVEPGHHWGASASTSAWSLSTVSRDDFRYSAMPGLHPLARDRQDVDLKAPGLGLEVRICHGRVERGAQTGDDVGRRFGRRQKRSRPFIRPCHQCQHFSRLGCGVGKKPFCVGYACQGAGGPSVYRRSQGQECRVAQVVALDQWYAVPGGHKSVHLAAIDAQDAPRGGPGNQRRS